MPNRPVLDFWYEFASPYSCLSALRIEELADRAGVDLRWRPFLLGPIFAAQGWNTSPFALFPSKGRYMWRDTARRARECGIAGDVLDLAVVDPNLPGLPEAFQKLRARTCRHGFLPLYLY